jgi:hypothetical protein
VLATGVLAPRALNSARRWFTAIEGIRRLDPLWRDLTGAFPQVTLPTSAPLTVRRAELRYDRHLLEIADALTLTRVRAGLGAEADPSERAAAALAASASRWTHDDGSHAACIAAGLLPTASSAAEEREHLLTLADAYRTVRIQARRLPQEARA